MSITGYTSVTSVAQGETIGFHLSTDDPSDGQRLTIERIGDAATSLDLRVDLRSQSTPPEAWTGFGWPVTTHVRIPATWPSGFYQLLDGPTFVLGFVVRAAAPGSGSRMLFQISVLTPAAYNSAGGKSFYSPAHDDAQRAQRVSLHRPRSSPRVANGDGSAPHIREARLVEWLHRKGIAVECCTSIDLHATPDLLSNYDCLIVGYHDEYWTSEMRDHCEAFVHGGGNLIVLSGNTCFRQVRLEDDDTTVVFHKHAGRDPHPDLDRATTVWANPPINRPPNSLLGVGWTSGAFRLDHPADDYTIRFPDHWVFDGVDVRELPDTLWYETDAADHVDEPEGYPRVTGHEGTPLGTTVLATGDLRHWPGKPGMATMTIFSRNGTVFNAASTNWLDQVGPHNPAVERITSNVINRLSRRTTHSWEHVGHARRGCGMAASNGRLYLATTENELWRRYPVGADVPWSKIGHANRVIAMAEAGDALYCVTSDNLLWSRPAITVETDWTRIGEGPTEGTRALAGVGRMLYAVDRRGALMQRPVDGGAASFAPVVGSIHGELERTPTINAMTAYGSILFASTTDDLLLRTDTDWINESAGWLELHHCNGAIGLAMVEWMLFVATDDDQLWRMDISGLRAP